MFGCIAAQAQMIVVETQSHRMLNRVRLEQPLTQIEGTSLEGRLEANVANTSW